MLYEKKMKSVKKWFQTYPAKTYHITNHCTCISRSR